MNLPITSLVVGFDSAWTATNCGAVASVLVRADATVQELGSPEAADFVAAEH